MTPKFSVGDTVECGLSKEQGLLTSVFVEKDCVWYDVRFFKYGTMRVPEWDMQLSTYKEEL